MKMTGSALRGLLVFAFAAAGLLPRLAAGVAPSEPPAEGLGPPASASRGHGGSIETSQPHRRLLADDDDDGNGNEPNCDFYDPAASDDTSDYFTSLGGLGCKDNTLVTLRDFADVDECMEACYCRSACGAFTYNTARGDCYLKARCDQPVQDDDDVSYAKTFPDSDGNSEDISEDSSKSSGSGSGDSMDDESADPTADDIPCDQPQDSSDDFQLKLQYACKDESFLTLRDVPSVISCERECACRTFCAAYTFNTGRLDCYLKKECQKGQYNDGELTGIKINSEDSSETSDGSSEDSEEKSDGKSEDSEEKSNGKSEDSEEKSDGSSEDSEEKSDGKSDFYTRWFASLASSEDSKETSSGSSEDSEAPSPATIPQLPFVPPPQGNYVNYPTSRCQGVTLQVLWQKTATTCRQACDSIYVCQAWSVATWGRCELKVTCPSLTFGYSWTSGRSLSYQPQPQPKPQPQPQPLPQPLPQPQQPAGNSDYQYFDNIRCLDASVIKTVWEKSPASCEAACESTGGCLAWSVITWGKCELRASCDNLSYDTKWQSAKRKTPVIIPVVTNPQYSVLEDFKCTDPVTLKILFGRTVTSCEQACSAEYGCQAWSVAAWGLCELRTTCETLSFDASWASGKAKVNVAAAGSGAQAPVQQKCINGEPSPYAQLFGNNCQCNGAALGDSVGLAACSKMANQCGAYNPGGQFISTEKACDQAASTSCISFAQTKALALQWCGSVILSGTQICSQEQAIKAFMDETELRCAPLM